MMTCFGGKSPSHDDLDVSQKIQIPIAPLAPLTVMPFDPGLCGPNLELSHGGFKASRVRGCRQSVAVGSAPLCLVSGWESVTGVPEAPERGRTLLRDCGGGP